MATEDITLRVRIDELEKELAKIPGVTEKQMKKMLSAVSSSYKAQQRVAEDSAKAQARAIEQAAKEAAQAAEKQLGALERVADKFTGGLAGDLKDLAESGLGPLGAAGTTAAIGVGATVAALVAMGAAAVGAVYALGTIQSAASDAIKELEELGQIEIVDPEYQQIVEDTAATLDALGAAVDTLTIALAANFGPQIQAVAIRLIDLTLAARDFLDSIADISILEMFARNIWQLSPAVGNAVAAFRVLVEGAAYVEEALTGQPSKIRAVVDRMGELADRAFVAATGIDGLAGAQGDLDTATSRGAQFVRDYTRRLREKQAADADEKEAAQGATRARDEQARAAKRAAQEERDLAAAQREAEQTAQAVERATDSLNRMRDQSLDPFLSDQERAQKNYLDELGQIDAIIQKTKERTLTAEQLYAVEQAGVEAATAARREYEAELAKLAAPSGGAEAPSEGGAPSLVGGAEQAGESYRETIGEMLAGVKAVDEAWSEFWPKQAENIAASFEEISSTYQPLIDIVEQIGASWEQLHRDRLDAIMEQRDKELDRLSELRGEERAASVERIKALTREANERRKQIAIAFKAQQAAAVANAIIDGARSAIALIPAFAYLGPGAPVAAAALAGTATAIQIASILSQKPKFHTGLDPSEIPAILTRGEGVANQRAMASPAFREQLSQANAGMAAPAMGGPVVIALNDRVLAQLDSRTQRITGRARGGTIALEVGTRAHYR